MCLYTADELLCALRQIGVVPRLVRYKDETSAEEFQHQKMLIIGSKGE